MGRSKNVKWKDATIVASLLLVVRPGAPKSVLVTSRNVKWKDCEVEVWAQSSFCEFPKEDRQRNRFTREQRQPMFEGVIQYCRPVVAVASRFSHINPIFHASLFRS